MDTSIFEHFYKSTGICTDTRSIKPNSLFICIKGENFDGNTFASKSLEEGANHVIVDNESYFVDNGRMTLVENSVLYLQNLANFHRKKFNIPVIGITGSNGKTTSKELINAVLSKKYNVLATQGNLNNHLGVPFTLLNLTSEHEIAIIEMGANKPFDIQELCDIAEPTHGIITNIGRAHLEGFENLDGVIKTKKELYDSIEKNHGVLFINNDDELLKSLAPKGINHFTYGASGASINGELVSLSPFVNMKWEYKNHQSDLLTTKMVGKYNFYNYLAAISFGVYFDVNYDQISDAIVEYSPTNNRSQITETVSNTVILDCYNANPTSMKSAIESFGMINHSNKICILGDMKELGTESIEEHKKIISLIDRLNLPTITVGPEFLNSSSEFILHRFKETNELTDFLKNNPIKDAMILVKGSRSIGLEKIEKEL